MNKKELIDDETNGGEEATAEAPAEAPAEEVEEKEVGVKLTKKEFTNLITNLTDQALSDKVKELGLDRVDRKHGMFPAHFIGKTEQELAKMEKKERISHFIKAVYRKDLNTLATMKALGESAGPTGGYQVPEEFAAEINRIAEDFGLVRRFARRVPMASDVMNMPVLGSSVSITYPGENTAGTESEPVWDNVQLLANTAVGLTVTSNELLADANISIVDLLAELFAEALAGSEDEQGLTGTGSPFTGILSAAGTNVVDLGGSTTSGSTTFDSITLDDLRDMVSALKPLALVGAGFVMHRSVWGVIQKLQSTTGGDYHISAANPVLLPGATAGQVGGVVVGSIWGYPVYLSEKMPATSATAVSTPFVIFGNLNHLWFGDRQTMTMSVSDAATVGANNTFEQNQSAVRVTERIGLAVGLPDAFAVARTSAT